MKKQILSVAVLLVALAASASAQVLLNEPFAYANGNLAGQGPWTAYSSVGSGPLQVTGGAAQVVAAQAEDDTAVISATPLTSGMLTATFDVTFSALPTTTGTYFFLLKDAGTSNFRARVYAGIANAATAGNLRLGVANAAGTVNATVPFDLSIGTTYTVTLNYDTAAASSVLNVGGQSATAADAASVIGITNVALRQSGGEGTLAVDNLSVSYVAAVPEPATVAYILGGLGTMALVRRRRRN